MYDVGYQPRCVATAEKLFNAIVALLDQGISLDEITIVKLCNAAGVSRGSFYKHFDSLTDIFSWKIDQCMTQAFRGGGYLAEHDVGALTESFYYYWVAHSEFLDLLVSCKLFLLFNHGCRKGFKTFFGPIIDKSDISDESKPYLVDLYASAATSIMRVWLTRGKKESAERLITISKHNNTLPTYKSDSKEA